MSPTALDHRLLVLARTKGHSPTRDRGVAAFSKAGEHAALWIALGLAGAALDPAKRPRWTCGLRAVALSYAANQAIKFTLRRPRPTLEGLPQLTATVSQLSFPSAHATTSFAAARAYRGLLPAGVLYALAVAMALSRPYLGVHYPSDIVAGAVLGTITGQVLTR